MTEHLDLLIKALTCLPGVGSKSAQRMAFHLLTKAKREGQHLSHVLANAIESIGQCQQCRHFTESDLCDICLDERRDLSMICVVESPADIGVIEQTGLFRGRYFVLMGQLSPIDGIGPDDIGLSQLKAWVERDAIQEIIVATNASVEGEATAHFIVELFKNHASTHVSRLAQGIPVGGSLEYLDKFTLMHALEGRKSLGPIDGPEASSKP